MQSTTHPFSPQRQGSTRKEPSWPSPTETPCDGPRSGHLTVPASRTRGNSVGCRHASAHFRLLRASQWIKNLFVVAPLVFSGSFGTFTSVTDSFFAFSSFCIASSLVYTLNDWRDRNDDIHHPTKRIRPIASAELRGKQVGLHALFLFLLLVLVLGIWIRDVSAYIILVIYLSLNCIYSFGMKSITLLGIMTVAVGFVLRVLYGAVVIQISPSSWIIFCTGFLATMLAIGKRQTDLRLTTAISPIYSPRGRKSVDTRITVLRWSIKLMAAATLITYSLFTTSDYANTHFDTSSLFWTIIPVIFGIIRYIRLVFRNEENRSPTELLFSDRLLQISIIVWIILFGLIGLW